MHLYQRVIYVLPFQYKEKAHALPVACAHKRNSPPEWLLFEYNSYRITNFEMESSALAGLSRLMGHKAMTVCMVIANRLIKEANTGYKNTIDTLIKTVLDRI